MALTKVTGSGIKDGTITNDDISSTTVIGKSKLEATPVATGSVSGLMSSTHKNKLDGIADNANNYTHPTSHTVSEVTGLQSALDAKVDDGQVLTNVPSGALFTDTVYSHPSTHTIAEVSGLQSALDTKTTPGYVDTSIASLVDSAPATLDTLNELAAALGDDANHVTTMTNLIGTKLPLAGGTMTGQLNLQNHMSITNSKSAYFGDNSKAVFGGGDDLQIYHDGVNSYINEVGTGNLYIKATNFTIADASGVQKLNAWGSGGVSLYTDGNVKLATTSTGIDVTGEVKFGTGDTKIYSPVANNLAFETNSTEQMRITTSGRLGIGTSSPDNKLHIYNADSGGSSFTDTYLTIENSGNTRLQMLSGTSSECEIVMGDSGSNKQGRITYSNASDALILQTTNAERMRITSAGNVGIGTSSPAQKLDVAGTVKATAFVGDGSGLTGIASSLDSLTDCTVSAATPTINTNPPIVGHLWIEEDSGEIYVCVDNTPGANIWKGQNGTDVTPLKGLDASNPATPQEVANQGSASGLFYIVTAGDSVVRQWYIDVDTAGGPYVLVSRTSSYLTSNPGNWFDSIHAGGFTPSSSGIYRGAGYWNNNSQSYVMFEVQAGNGATVRKVKMNWAGTNFNTIPSRTWNTFVQDVGNASHFAASYNGWNSSIKGQNNFSEHFLVTWSGRGAGGNLDVGESGRYFMLGSHYNGTHQHHEEAIVNNDGDGTGSIIYGSDWKNGGIAESQHSGYVNIWVKT